MAFTPEQVMAAVAALAADEKKPRLSATTSDIAQQCRRMGGDDPYRTGTGDVTTALRTLIDRGELVTHKGVPAWGPRRGTAPENPAYEHISRGYQDRWYATPANADKLKAQLESAEATRERAEQAADRLSAAFDQPFEAGSVSVSRTNQQVRVELSVEQADWLTRAVLYAHHTMPPVEG